MALAASDGVVHGVSYRASFTTALGLIAGQGLSNSMAAVSSGSGLVESEGAEGVTMTSGAMPRPWKVEPSP